MAEKVEEETGWLARRAEAAKAAEERRHWEMVQRLRSGEDGLDGHTWAEDDGTIVDEYITGTVVGIWAVTPPPS